MHYPNLVHRDWRGGVCAADALVMSFYMQHPHGQIASAAIRAMELFRERIRPHALAWINIGEGQSEPLADETWKKIRKRTLEPEPEQSAFIEMEDDPRRFAGYCANYRGLGILPLPYPFRKDDVSVLYFRMPTEFLVERGPKYVHTLALELAAELPFNSGYADFVLCCSSFLDIKETLPLINPRYPGVSIARDQGNIQHINTWVDGVHWMNFLGQPVLGNLGGLAGLREHLDLPGISLHEMSGERVLITLGDAPETGDLEAGQSLPLHRALARLLEPHLYHWKTMMGRPGPEALARWERRFLD